MSRNAIVAAAIFVGVFGYAFSEILVGDKTVVHGDALSVALPFQKLFVDALAEGRFPLWSSLIYGGHPVFGEGQGAFAHPLTWLVFGPVAWFGTAETESAALSRALLHAHGIFHFLTAWIAALGMYALGRAYGLRPAAAIFAGLALAGSQGWFYLTSNATIAGATAWVPWFFAALERWRLRPDRARTLELGGAAALLALAGYPQTVHAVALFGAIVFAISGDRNFWQTSQRHALMGLAAVAFAIALSSVQWLATLELAAESIRAEGTALVYSHTFAELWRGALYTVGDRNPLWPGLGSLLVFVLALFGLQRDRRVVALGVAVLALYQLGMGEHSWLYRASHAWLPGLDRFRIVWMYSTVGMVGLALLSGFGVDALLHSTRSDPAMRMRLAIAVIASAAFAFVLYIDAASLLTPLIAALGLGAVARLWSETHAPKLGVVLVVLLVVEIAVLRTSLERPGEIDALMAPPSTVGHLLERDAARRGDKVINYPHTHTAITFAPADRENIPALADQFLHSVGDGSSTLWGLASLRSNLALPSERVSRVERILEREARGELSPPPGRRLIDALGIRYFVFNWSAKDEPSASDLRKIFEEPTHGFWIRENTRARERVRLIREDRVQFVRDAGEAEAVFARAEGHVLVVEDEARMAGGQTAPAAPPNPSPAGQLGEIIETPGAVEIDVGVEHPAYLFIQDAPNPGWRADIDGEPAPIFAANLLGKAIRLEPGRHVVRLRYAPASFTAGLWISALAALAFVVLRSTARGGPVAPPAHSESSE